MTDISTKAITDRCDHIDRCSMRTHGKDALRMRALVAERDALAAKLDMGGLVRKEITALVRDAALVEAAEKIAGQEHVDGELRRGRLQAPGILTRAFETILALRSSRCGCPKCGGSGMMDSGGVQPWGEHIDVPCDCRDAPEASPIAALLPEAVARAEKAMLKWPAPNYTLSKFAEESGEAHKAMIHLAEGRESWENLRDELVDTLAMLHRLFVEGDEVHGLPSLNFLAQKDRDDD